MRVNSKQEMNLSFFSPETIQYAEFGQYNKCLNLFINMKVLHCDEITNLKNDFLMLLTEIEEIHVNDESMFRTFFSFFLTNSNDLLKTIPLFTQ